ncbi:MAG: hypothetical protein HY695_20555 [Deltaproteobacteria bacterium]|nr:hypothetical protein [Deltaproteobacteria bacterium]
MSNFLRNVSKRSKRRGLDEFTAIAERIIQDHEGPGHDLREEIDPETGDKLVSCDACKQVLCLTSANFPECPEIED